MGNSQDFVFTQYSFGKAERAVLVQEVAWASAAGEWAHPTCIFDARMRCKKQKESKTIWPKHNKTLR